MKKFFSLLFHVKLKRLLIEPTNNTALQSFRYLFVGGFSALADWATLYLLESIGLHYLLATFFAFIVGLIANFILSKRLVFKIAKARTKGQIGEFTGYAIIGIVGLVFTELLMYLFTDICGLYFMLSKIIATVIVLIWNFTARKFILYKN